MNNQEFLIEYLLKDLAEYLVEEEGIDIPTALQFIYNSETYSKLMDPETGLYFQSSGYVYEFLKEEYHLGKFTEYSSL